MWTTRAEPSIVPPREWATLKRELKHVRKVLGEHRPAIFGLAFLALVSLAAIFAPQLAPFDPEAADQARSLLPPSAHHWFGTDTNGMDIYSRILWGGRIDLTIAVISSALGVTIGTVLGAFAGFYFGRRGPAGLVSELLLRGTDSIQAFPVFVLALGLVAVLGRNIYDLLYALVILFVPIFLRLARSSVIGAREETYVDAAKCSGSRSWRLVLLEILPNALTPSITNASVVAGSAVLVTAGLSFVGAGVPAPTPEWGSMIAVGSPNLYTGQWWPALIPGIAIGLVILSFALVGEAVAAYLDPNQR